MATSGREWIPLSRAWEGWGQAGAEAAAPRAEEEQAESLIAGKTRLVIQTLTPSVPRAGL